MCIPKQHVIQRNHDLLRIEPYLIGDLFEGIYRSPIDIGLAGFAQAIVADRNVKALHEALKRSRSAIHCGRLNHFVSQPTLGHRKVMNWM